MVKIAGCQYAGRAMREIGQADKDALVTRLEACQAVKDARLRAQLVDRLPVELRRRVSEDGSPMVVANELVKICAGRPEGLQQLREAVAQVEGNTFAMQKLDAECVRLGLPVVERGARAPDADVPNGEEHKASVQELVTELVERLAEQRKAGSLSGQIRAASESDSELSARIDWLVSTIKRRFAPREGSQVAGAVLVRVVCSGNFCTIWHAEDADTSERVAVKIFRLERLSEGQMLSRFRRSIRAMRRLGEKKRLGKRDDTRGQIVRYRAEDDSGLAFAMDYLSQGNLVDVNQRGWSLERKLEVMLSVSSAVRYAHQNGVIHRDIKPANIVLDDDKQPVLTDFDIADIKWATSLSTTMEGGLGTPVFAAPEQLVDAELATEATDVYRLGRFLYDLLLERSPGYEVEKDPSLDNLSDQRPALVEIVRKATQYYPQPVLSICYQGHRESVIS